MDAVTDAITIKSNHHTRPLVAYVHLPEGVGQAEFDYFADQTDLDEDGDSPDLYTPRFFQYRGSWYDLQDGFQLTSEFMAAEGWDGVQPESYFSAVVVQWFDAEGNHRDDEIVVGYAHW